MSIKLGGYHLTCSTLCSTLEQYQTKSYHTIKEVHPTPQNTLRYSGKIAKPLLITNTPVVHERGEYIEKLLPNLLGTFAIMWLHSDRGSQNAGLCFLRPLPHFGV